MTATFLDDHRPFPYCPGCGHPHVLRALDEALAASQVPPERIVLVTDIGCVGLADLHFPTLHTVHALHGRAAAVAVGIRLGSERDLKPVVLVGDGGASIGLLHLVHAAQLNVDVTVLVHNNLIYGMTGGQHSTLTPEGLETTTTPDGCPVPPIDLCTVLVGAGCTYFARERAPGAALEKAILQGLRHPGFACIEALELCPTFASRTGGVTGKDLDAMARDRTGVLHHDAARPPFAPPARAATADPLAAGIAPDPTLAGPDAATHRIVLAGKAGERVQSAARFAASVALAAGLFATVRTENPVTQGKGFSLAELIVSPKPIDFTGLDRPDHVIVLSEEGRDLLEQKGILALAGDLPFLVDDALAEGPLADPPVQARPLRKTYGAKAAALGALLGVIEKEGWWADGAFERALGALPESIARETRKVLDKVRAGSAVA